MRAGPRPGASASVTGGFVVAEVIARRRRDGAAHNKPSEGPFGTADALPRRLFSHPPPVPVPLLRALGLTLAVLILLPACDSAADFEIGGTYSGSFDNTLGSDNDAELTVSDTASGGRFTFQYTLVERSGDGASVSETEVGGTGTYDHPKVTLTVEGETIDGTVSDDGDTIRLDAGDGFIITLTR